MIRPDFAKWDQSPTDILHEAMEAAHPRTRERCLALYMIGTGMSNATRWAREIGRQDDTVLQWMHQYNERGMEGIVYRHSGGRSPFLPRSRRRRSSIL